MIEFLDGWAWLGWVVLGLWACWAVLVEAYGDRPKGQGRD